MSFTLDLSVYGAVTGTIGAVVAIRNRLDASWARRSRVLAVRADLVALRDLLAEAKARPERAGALTATITFKGHIQALDEAKPGCPGRKERNLLTEVNNRCLNIPNLVLDSANTSISYALTHGIEIALDSVTEAIDRLDRIQRNTPG